VIDGYDLDKDAGKIKTELGVVYQSSALDQALTVYDNLKYRAALYGITKDDFRKRLDTLSEILDFKDLLKRTVGKLSGGQRRRIDIARALLHSPKILILDDSTSAVDTATEKKIREAFAKDLEGTTKIIIAQRIGSVKDADKIVVMNEGRITGIGTHDELLANNTEYKEIYDSQTDRGEASEYGSKNA